MRGGARWHFEAKGPAQSGAGGPVRSEPSHLVELQRVTEWRGRPVREERWYGRVLHRLRKFERWLDALAPEWGLVSRRDEWVSADALRRARFKPLARSAYKKWLRPEVVRWARSHRAVVRSQKVARPHALQELKPTP